MIYISLKTLIEKYIEGSTIDFCTDESAYGFVLGLTRPDNSKIIIKLNLNYFSPYGKSSEPNIRAKTVKRGKKKNQNIDDFRREVSNQTEFVKLSSAIPHIKVSSILQREEAIKFSKALLEIPKNCDHLDDWTTHLLKQLNTLHIKHNYKYETKTGVIIMNSVGDLTLDDIVKGEYSELQKFNLSSHTIGSYTIAETFKGKARALLLSLLWMGILHGDPHMENIRVNSTTGKLYLIDFGASIDFGSGPVHLPKYLRKSKEAMDIFAKITTDVVDWLPLTENLTEHGFTTQYKALLDKAQPNVTISKELLEHTIVKADPRQNGDLLTWSDMGDSRWDLYRNGYEWIVDVDNDEHWKTIIQHAILNEHQENESRHIPNVTKRIAKRSPFHRTKRMPNKKSSHSPSKSDLMSGMFTRKTRQDLRPHSPSKRDLMSGMFTRKSRQDIRSHSPPKSDLMTGRVTRKTRQDIESLLANESRNSLLSATTKAGLTTGTGWSQTRLIDKILENEDSMSGILNSLNKDSQSATQPRYNLRAQSV